MNNKLIIGLVILFLLSAIGCATYLNLRGDPYIYVYNNQVVTKEEWNRTRGLIKQWRGHIPTQVFVQMPKAEYYTRSKEE